MEILGGGGAVSTMLPKRPCYELSILSQSNRQPFVQPQLVYLNWSRFGLPDNSNVVQSRSFQTVFQTV